ncbi:hypothetical protein NFI95_12715 [Acetobacteraceae bacterium KSS8]|uniref:Alpha/beta hydrolase n=1 Tax=Endosaccharibacter trunci TaxID=2812733 RepID=A0ABT1W8T2_9PROT|nr:hypothetical protein [Acetobacteraceae bacterium KSS8]
MGGVLPSNGAAETPIPGFIEEPTLLYDDLDIRVIWRAGSSNYLLITFGDLVGLANGLRFAADIPAAKAGINCIGIVAKRPNWYPVSSIHAAFATIAPILRDFSLRITYGGSMGGYAAIKYSKLFGATHIIAMCPQWSIDPTECDGHHPGWASYFEPRLSGMGIKTEDVSGAVTVMADPFDRIDRFHLERIARAAPNLLVIGVFFVGHHITHVFAGTKTLVDIIAAAMAADQQSLIALSRSARKDHNVRFEKLIDIGTRRMPRFAGRLISSRLREGRLDRRLGAKYAILVISQYLKAGDPSSAADYYEIVKEDFAEPSQAIVAALLVCHANGAMPAIKTTHRTVIYFSLVLGFCVHAARGSLEGGTLLPVHFDLVGRGLALFVNIGPSRVYLHAHPDGRIGFATESTSVPVFQMSPSSGEWFALEARNLFLSAEREGQITANRTEIGGWERFTIEIAVSSDHP